MPARACLLLLLLAGCAGVQELACRMEGDAAGQLARPALGSTACIGFPCTPPMRDGRPVWSFVSEAAYQGCRRSLPLAAREHVRPLSHSSG